jgi:transketolase
MTYLLPNNGMGFVNLADLALKYPKNLVSLHENPGKYIDLRGVSLSPISFVNEKMLEEVCRIVRGLVFTTVDGAKSGHPGGSSSKVEQLVTLLLSGAYRFDAWNPKDPCRDRLVWSAGHCSPLAHSLVALIYEALGKGVPEEAKKYTLRVSDLAKFRTLGGPSGHVEAHYALQDATTGSSGHGLSDALGRAILFKSCGLPINVFTIMGDAETEEGMSFEARNVASNLSLSNLIVLLDHNNYGIDGPITEAVASSPKDQWTSFGWNVIQVNGHNIRELSHAYHLAENGFENHKPTVVIAHTTKGLHYGKLENTCTSHGTPLSHDDYVIAMQKLGFSGVTKENTTEENLNTVSLTLSEEMCGTNNIISFLCEELFESLYQLPEETDLIQKMKETLKGRPDGDYRSVKRPDTLPPELVFKQGEPKATRFATEACFKWEMEHNPLFYVGTGDLSSSILTRKAEDVYGIITPDSPLGRGIRWGIAEQNMAMASVALSQETLPGGYKPMTAFASYAVFASMMANSVRMGLINNAMSKNAHGFFIMLSAHDGPETGEDGATHHGEGAEAMYFMACPGIKVYKPLDANEAVEMYFHACQHGEPIDFHVSRPNTMVFVRDETTGIPPASEARNGAYVFQKYANNGKKKLAIVVAGGKLAENLKIAMPKIAEHYDVKVIAVPSPELFEEFKKKNPEQAEKILSPTDKQNIVGFHNGTPMFLYTLVPPERVHGITEFLASGRPDEIYLQAGLDPEGIVEKILKLT